MRGTILSTEWARSIGVSEQRAKMFCASGRIPAAYKEAGRWRVPVNTPDPRLPHGRPPQRKAYTVEILKDMQKWVDRAKELWRNAVQSYCKTYGAKWPYYGSECSIMVLIVDNNGNVDEYPIIRAKELAWTVTPSVEACEKTSDSIIRYLRQHGVAAWFESSPWKSMEAGQKEE